LGAVHGIILDKQVPPRVLHFAVAELFDEEIDVCILRGLSEVFGEGEGKAAFVGEE
jgi:hypothetical protein